MNKLSRFPAVKMLSLLLLAAALPLLCGADLEIVKGGKSPYVIAFAENPSQNLAREYRSAAALLKDLIRLRTGVTVPFVSNGGSSMMSCWGLLAFIKACDTRQNASFSVRLSARRRRSALPYDEEDDEPDEEVEEE